MNEGGSSLTICLRDDEPRWKGLTFDVGTCCETALRASFKAAGQRECGEVSILLSSDTVMAQLNQRYRGVHGSTNVLSFPSVQGEFNDVTEIPYLLGDIVVSFETVVAEAKSANITTQAHLAHMVVHGALHLLGFDHQHAKEADMMENLEVQSLATLGIRSPFLKHCDGC